MDEPQIFSLDGVHGVGGISFIPKPVAMFPEYYYIEHLRCCDLREIYPYTTSSTEPPGTPTL